MLKNVYEGLNARPKVYLSKEYYCETYPTCVSSKLCEFILHQMLVFICLVVFMWRVVRSMWKYTVLSPIIDQRSAAARTSGDTKDFKFISSKKSHCKDIDANIVNLYI